MSPREDYHVHGCWPPAQGRHNHTASDTILSREIEPHNYGAAVSKRELSETLTFQFHASSLSEQKNNAGHGG